MISAKIETLHVLQILSKALFHYCTNCYAKYLVSPINMHGAEPSRHTVVLHGPKKTWCNIVGIFIERTNLRFSRLCSFVMPDPNSTKFTVEIPYTQGKPHSKFNHSLNTCSNLAEISNT